MLYAPPNEVTRPLSVAPMMKCTDRHFRVFMRKLTRHTLLYTEMVTMGAVIHGDREHLLAFSREEKPLVLQVGGDDPRQMAQCARIAEDWGYDEVNINVGCPSDRVQSGNFGACLMTQPEVVAECVAAMQAACSIPVTVKHRIGVDDVDRYEDMLRFVDVVSSAGCTRFTVHARKAWLQGLSPKENRNIPPLRYSEVHQLKAERPQLFIEINGGILNLDQAEDHLEHVDAVMIGRAAYDTPWIFAEADACFFDDPHPVPTRHEVVESLYPYVERHLSAGGRLHQVSRHLLGLFFQQPGTRAFKRHIAENAHKPGAGIEVLEAALARVPREV